jgi:hypothetical protein
MKVKIAVEKVQLSTLITDFSIFSPIDSLLYSLLAFKYYFSLFLLFLYVLPTLNERKNIEFSHIL